MSGIRMLRLILMLIGCMMIQPALAANKATPATKPSPCMPFVGEQMRFDVGWEFINAGSADMAISGNPSGWQIKTLAKTNRFFDMFKKVRDTITAKGVCIHARMQSTVFDIEQHERNYHASKQTRFLWQQGKATFRQNKKTDAYDVPAGHLSVLDAFFAVRMMPLQPGKTLSVPVFDSRKRYEIVVSVGQRKKKMKAPWGGFVDCIEVEPKLKTEGIFSSKGKIKIWMTDDARHIPLKMTAKIKIGHIVALLKNYQSPKKRI